MPPDYAQSIETDGFAIVPAAVDNAEIGALIAVVETLAQEQPPAGGAGIYALRNLLVHVGLKSPSVVWRDPNFWVKQNGFMEQSR